MNTPETIGAIFYTLKKKMRVTSIVASLLALITLLGVIVLALQERSMMLKRENEKVEQVREELEEVRQSQEEAEREAAEAIAAAQELKSQAEKEKLETQLAYASFATNPYYWYYSYPYQSYYGHNVPLYRPRYFRRRGHIHRYGGGRPQRHGGPGRHRHGAEDK